MDDSMSQEPLQHPTLQLSDTAIGMIRDLLQVAMFTGVNVVDLFRAMRFETSQEKPGVIIPSPGYVKSYNDMIEKLETQVEELSKTLGEDPGLSPSTN